MSQLLRAETKEQQSGLAEYCRTGNEASLAGTTHGRLSHYRRLVTGVVDDVLKSSYPLTKNLLTEKEWENLCDDFFATHKCLDPQVWKMPFELIAYTESHQSALCNKYPHLLELLHFEWKEVEYYMMPDRTFPKKTGADIWSDIWALNPESEIMTLTYPVHMKNARFISRTDHGQFFCLIYRQPETGKVMFLNLSPFFAWLLATMMAETTSVKELFPIIQSQFGINEQGSLIINIRPFYDKLIKDGMLIA